MPSKFKPPYTHSFPTVFYFETNHARVGVKETLRANGFVVDNGVEGDCVGNDSHYVITRKEPTE